MRPTPGNQDGIIRRAPGLTTRPPTDGAANWGGPLTPYGVEIGLRWACENRAPVSSRMSEGLELNNQRLSIHISSKKGKRVTREEIEEAGINISVYDVCNIDGNLSSLGKDVYVRKDKSF